MAQCGISAGEQWPQPGAKVLLIYPAEKAELVSPLRAEWCGELPRAEFISLETTLDQTLAALVRQVRTLIAEPQRAVCVGLFGVEPVSLWLALNACESLFRGLVCQDGLPEHQTVMIPHPSSRGMKVRLVWEVEDAALSAAAMAELLAVFRKCEIDAEGTVFNTVDGLPPSFALHQNLSTTASRMVGSYLAELVAVALHPSIPIKSCPA